MKNAIILLSLCLIAALLWGCKTKQYTLTEYEGAQISFGSGGGFTGMSTNYILFENGQVFKKGGRDKEYMTFGLAKKNDVKQIFINYEVLKLKEVQLQEPGNMTYHVNFKDKEEEHKITWGGTNQPASTEVKLFYQLLNNIVKTINEENKDKDNTDVKAPNPTK